MNYPIVSPSPSHLPARGHQLPAIPLGPPARLRDRSSLTCPAPMIRNSRDSDVDYLPVQRVEPLSFEQALAIGRGAGAAGAGRQLPSPMPNGYKPARPGGQVNPAGVPSRDHFNRRSLNQRPVASRPLPDRRRRSESDEDDWC